MEMDPFASEVQTARANVAGATRDELNDTPQRPSEAAAPTDLWRDERRKIQETS